MSGKQMILELDFVKSQGIGNDFIILDCYQVNLDDYDLSRIAMRLCDRNFGVGADGLILVLPSENANHRMRIFNPDGSEAEMCGNGIRCFARYVFERGMSDEIISVETPAGIKQVKCLVSDSGELEFAVNMGFPLLNAEQIPILGFEGPVVSKPLVVDGNTYSITCVSMGNPHCVIFTDSEIQLSDLCRIGPAIENNPVFPKRTNVEFVKVISPNEMRVWVWERGAGATLACGTGACASLVAGVLNGRTERTAKVSLPGGDLFMCWNYNESISLIGPAQEVFTGHICLRW